MAAAVVLIGGLAAPAPAQTAAGSNEPGRFEISAGAGWWSGYDLGSSRATLPGQGGVLFDAEAAIGGGPAASGRFAWRLWRGLSIEGSAAVSRARLQSAVRSDVDPSLNASLETSFTQLTGEGGVLVPLPTAAFAGGRFVPFLSGGAGYLRQLYDDGVVLDTGRVVYGGGGVRLPLGGSSPDRWLKRVGVRVDARLVVRSGGIDVDETPRAFFALLAGGYVRF